MTENLTGKCCFRVDAKGKRISDLTEIVEHERTFDGSYRLWAKVRGFGLLSISRLVVEGDPRFADVLASTQETRIPCPHCGGKGYTVEAAR